jgi:hypothetical protein
MRYGRFVAAMLGLLASAWVASAEQLPIPYPTITAPVVHFGRYHVLTCGRTSIVLDGARGMSVSMIGYSDDIAKPLDTSDAVLTHASLRATVRGAGGEEDLDQAFDPAARLMVIDQGPGRVAARAFFMMSSKDGLPHGSGTLDVYVYGDRVFFVPSLYIDYESGGLTISASGFRGTVPGKGAEVSVGGSKIVARESSRLVPFGEDRAEFGVLVNNPGHASMKIGWPRNTFPSWLYMNEIDKNPETDEIYEKWPLWIMQRDGPLSWKQGEHSGLQVGFTGGSVQRLDFLWLNGDRLEVPAGGHVGLKGVMGVFLGLTPARAEEVWNAYRNPVKPVVKGGEFRYFNEIEGVYEINSKGGDVEVTFDNTSRAYDQQMFVRFWNLAGKGGYAVKANRERVPFGLYNDGDLVEDPYETISMLKQATGPARFAGVAVPAGRASSTTVSLTRVRGVQFSYQMYSDMETYEAWTNDCTDRPLFRFHVATGDLYSVTLPGRRDFAMSRLPLYMMLNGVNQNTYMNQARGFRVLESNPGEVKFSYTSTNLQGTGLSVFNVAAQLIQGRIAFDFRAEFTPLDDGKRWTTVEYCDLYPFDNTYRRNFHYRDIVFLNKSGVFDRVGTGCWSGRFNTVQETDHLGYYSESGPREKGISRTPEGDDGTVWLLGDSHGRGNILYRRGEWQPSTGARSVLSICNAWVDIHNVAAGRVDLSSKETISYTVDVFGGPLPSLDQLNAMYVRAAGEKTVKQVTAVKFGPRGTIEGFEVK